jgi:NADP-dependent alcohol dehydrogenase
VTEKDHSMRNFSYYCPTRVVFGEGTIREVGRLVPPAPARILVTYGQGSVERNGVLAAVMAALAGREVVTFCGIEPNPQYETLLRAVALCRERDIDFLLAVGGGSVLDGTKFIAAARFFEGADPWDLLAKQGRVARALPLGAVLTLPATGSEANANAVISRAALKEKRHFGSELVIPRFAVLDPTTTFTLDARQTANGVVDAFVHVTEQYVTYDVNTPLQDRQAEAILSTLIEEGPKVLGAPADYAARANVMWCATQALNGLLACGTVGDWATHMIGHELTALWGLDHAQSLAVVLPGVWRYARAAKLGKLAQMAERVWGVDTGAPAARAEAAIARTVAFFHDMGVQTDPLAYGIPPEGFGEVAQRLHARGARLGERGDIGRDEILAILRQTS